jgi:hypothetical protein
MKDFKEALGDGSHVAAISKLKQKVIDFSKSFDAVGFDVTSMKYK